MRKTKETKKNRGITLISLIVTIIVLLILAGISIAILNGDSGIIKKSKEAKEQTEISEEKEVVDRATVQAMGNNKKGDLIENELQEQLDKIASSGKTEVTDTGEEFEILFKESNRCYTVDKEGNILEQQIIEKIEYAGDITKNGQYDGSEEKPYQITCIEDLVAYSNMAKGSGVILKNGKIEELKGRTIFYEKNVELVRNLNFKSNYSYEDSKRTDFGDLNANGTVETIKEELTKTDEGCIGFTPIDNEYTGSNRNCNFNGKNHAIRNIYIHKKKGKTALFNFVGNIQDFTLTGTIINDTWEAGGISCNAKSIQNCTNFANVTGYNYSAGICASESNYIKNSANYGNIVINGSDYASGGAGGIGISKLYENCINYGSIYGITTYIGGICGALVNNDSTSPIIIDKCINYGKISEKNEPSWKTIGGILGKGLRGDIKIINSCNYGEVKSEASAGGGILGAVAGANWDVIVNVEIANCVNYGIVDSSKTTSGGIVGYQGTLLKSNTITLKNIYNLADITGNMAGDVIGKIEKDKRTETKTIVENVYYSKEPFLFNGEITSGSGTLKTKEEMHSQAFVDLLNQNIGSNSDWKRWKLGEKGYPELDL